MRRIRKTPPKARSTRGKGKRNLPKDSDATNREEISSPAPSDNDSFREREENSPPRATASRSRNRRRESPNSPNSPPRRQSTHQRPLFASDLPRFDETDPINWVNTINNIFKLYSVNDPKEKVKLLSTILPTTLIAKLTFPLSSNCYRDLLQDIEATFAPCLRESVRTVFKHGLKENERPSEYLERVKSALGNSNYSLLVNNDARFMRELFLSEMPIPIQISLQTMVESASIEEIVRIADNMFKMFSTLEGTQNPFPHVNNGWGQAFSLREGTARVIAKSNQREEEKDHDCLRELIKSHSEILKQIKDLSSNVNFIAEKLYSDRYERENQRDYGESTRRGRSASVRRNTNAGRNRAGYQRDADICVHHQQFGHRSYKCEFGQCAMAPLLNKENKPMRSTNYAARSDNAGNE